MALSDFAQALQLGAQIGGQRRQARLQDMQIQGQQQQQQQQIQQQQQFNTDLQNAIQTNNLRGLVQQYPDRLQQIQSVNNYMTQLKQSGAQAPAGQLFAALDRGDTQGAAQIIQQNAEGINAIGDASFTADTALQLLQSNPEQLKQLAGTTYQMAGGDLSAIGGDQLTAAEREKFSIERAKLGIDQQEVDIKKDQQELARLKQQMDSATDSIARQKAETELQIKQADLQAKQQKIQQDKQNAANAVQDSISTIDQTIDTVDRLLAAPGLSSATGFGQTWFVPTFSGTEKIAAEAIYNQLKGQQFLANVSQLQGMGALSDAEGNAIRQAASSLDLKMPDDVFVKEAQRIRSLLEDAKSKARKRAGGILEEQQTQQQDVNSLLGKYGVE